MPSRYFLFPGAQPSKFHNGILPSRCVRWSHPVEQRGRDMPEKSEVDYIFNERKAQIMEKFQLGVLLVHGIGTQPPRDTLVRWGDALINVIGRATKNQAIENQAIENQVVVTVGK